MKRGTEDLDFFIGDEALAAVNGRGNADLGNLWEAADYHRIRHTLSYSPWTSRELGNQFCP